MLLRQVLTYFQQNGQTPINRLKKIIGELLFICRSIGATLLFSACARDSAFWCKLCANMSRRLMQVFVVLSQRANIVRLRYLQINDWESVNGTGQPDAEHRTIYYQKAYSSAYCCFFATWFWPQCCKDQCRYAECWRQVYITDELCLSMQRSLDRFCMRVTLQSNKVGRNYSQGVERFDQSHLW